MSPSTSPRRIVLVGPVHPAPGGIVHFTDGLAGALAARGPSLVLGWKRRFPSALYPGTVEDETSSTVVSAEGEAILDLLDPRTWRTAVARVRAFDADLLVLQWWHPMHAPVVRHLLRAARRSGVDTAVICHNVEPHETNGLWRALTRRTLRAAGTLVTHAGPASRDARRIAPGANVVEAFLPVFDNVAAATGAADPDAVVGVRTRCGATARPLLLTFGYVRPYKGVEDAIAAVAAAATTPALLVAGECWDGEEHYRALAAASPAADRITLDLRYIPNDELPAMFAAADAVLLPYREATQSGVAALAFAYGRPVIATDAGGLAELVSDGATGAVAPAGDPAALAAAIDRVLGTPRDWRPAIAALRERLSWERYVALLEGVRPTPSRDAASHAVLDTASRRAKAAKIAAVLARHVTLAGARILDLGTGSGTIAAELARRAGPTGAVTSADVTDVRVARDGYAFVRLDGPFLPFAGGTFDVVVSNHVLEHVGDADAQRDHLAEIARVLRPGGLAYVALPHRWQLVENHYRLPVLGWLPSPLADRYVRATGRAERFDVRALGRRELVRMLRDAGLDASDVTGELIDVSAHLGLDRPSRLIRRLPAVRGLLRGPLLPTIVAIGRRPAGVDV